MKEKELSFHFVDVFPWNTNFETGISRIDEEHKKIVNLLNILASHIAYRSDSITLDRVFTELANYALYHFKSEDDIWKEYFGNDPWAELHKQEHIKFVEDIERIKKNTEAKPSDLVLEDILKFLTHWLAFHILENDKRMSKVVLAKKAGMSIQDAKVYAEKEMAGALKVLINTILSMYDSLANRTLELMREISQRQKAEARNRLSASVFDKTVDAICITDPDFHILEANPSFCQITGENEESALGKDLSLLKSGFADKNLIEEIRTDTKNLGHWSGIIRNRLKSGEMETEWLTLSAIREENGLVVNYVAVFSNVSHLLKRQKDLEIMAHHDALTGLPNRLLFQDRLNLALAHAKRSKKSLAVIYIDLDGFKPVNDMYGHAVGDIVLKEFANLGGDEFVLLVGDLKTETDYTRVMEKVLQEAKRAIEIGEDRTVNVSASIGISLFPKDNSEADTLLHHADQAMYEAKRLGKSRYYIFPA